jgi:hypothetical protein
VSLRSGLHAPNAPFTEADFEVVRLGGFTSCKVMPYHSVEDVRRLRALGVEHFTLRSPDSVFWSTSGQYIPSYWDYAAHVADTVMKVYYEGVRDLQLDNEPNITWRAHRMGPWQYRFFLLHTLSQLRRVLPSDVRIGLPPVSFASEFAPVEWLLPMKDDLAQFDFACVNAYWQSDRTEPAHILHGPMTWLQFGGVPAWYEQQYTDGKVPLQISEWGNSIHEQAGRTAEEVERYRTVQYPLYEAWVANECPTVEAMHVYIAPGSTPDWAGFRVSANVARAMRAGRA